MNFKYAIFDMDGTLIDSMETWRIIQVNAAERIAGFKAAAAERLSLMKLPFGDMLRRAEEMYGVTIDKNILSDTVNEEMGKNYLKASINLKPYADEYLAYLKENGIKIALATATQKIYVLPFLEKKDILKYFDVILTTSDDVCVSKFTAPDVYDTAMSKLGGKKEETIIFEDVLPAIRTAKKAGYTVYAVADDNMTDDDKTEILKTSDRYVKTYKELFR